MHELLPRRSAPSVPANKKAGTAPRKPSVVRTENAVVAVLLALVLSLVYLAAEMSALARPAQDMAAYWSAAHLIRQNPYSIPLVRGMELSIHARIPPGSALVIRNPPWALPLVLPLRVMSFPVAYAFWTVLGVLIVAGCGRALWRLYSSKPSLSPAFLCLLFGPSLLLFNLGQTTAFVLLGITVFLYAIQKGRDWVAGSMLLLIVIKPQIVFPFLLVLALWIVYTKRWAVIVSATAAVCTSSLLAVWLNPRIFRQYAELFSQFRYENYLYNNVGGFLYLATRQHWLAFLPEIAGTTWVVAYWWQNRHGWEWKTNGTLVLLVSVACSYYSYGYDEVLALPALVAASAVGNRKILWTGFVLMNIWYPIFFWYQEKFEPLFLYFLYFAGAAWLVLYLLSQRKTLAKGSPSATPVRYDNGVSAVLAGSGRP
jgi:hypothetical protein